MIGRTSIFEERRDPSFDGRDRSASDADEAEEISRDSEHREDVGNLEWLHPRKPNSVYVRVRAMAASAPPATHGPNPAQNNCFFDMTCPPAIFHGR